MDYDIAVIGAGPGGYTAAIRASQKGKKVALIEKEKVGGVCLNMGCIPTKAIAASAELLERIRSAKDFGIEISGVVSANFSDVMKRKDAVVSALSAGIHRLLKANKIDLIKGSASFISSNSVRAGNLEIHAENVIIATGSSWAGIAGLEPDGDMIVTSDHILKMSELPKKLLIIGGGVIGCEFASIMRAFGVDVTIVEMMDTLLPQEGTLVGRQLAKYFEKLGISVNTGKTVKEVVREKGIVYLNDGCSIEADKILVSVGRKPYTEGLNLTAAGLKTEHGFITVDKHLKTGVANIYAIGDVIGNYMLAHVASREGIVAVDNICGGDVEMRYHSVPRPIFTSPMIAAVGMTETELKKKGISYKTGRFSFQAVSKAVCDGETDGNAAVYTDEDGTVLGAYIMGPHAAELIAEVGLAIDAGLKAGDIARTIHPHPTDSEIIKETMDDVFGESIHKAGK